MKIGKALIIFLAILRLFFLNFFRPDLSCIGTKVVRNRRFLALTLSFVMQKTLGGCCRSPRLTRLHLWSIRCYKTIGEAAINAHVSAIRRMTDSWDSNTEGII